MCLRLARNVPQVVFIHTPELQLPGETASRPPYVIGWLLADLVNSVPDGGSETGSHSYGLALWPPAPSRRAPLRFLPTHAASPHLGSGSLCPDPQGASHRWGSTLIQLMGPKYSESQGHASQVETIPRASYTGDWRINHRAVSYRS